MTRRVLIGLALAAVWTCGPMAQNVSDDLSSPTLRIGWSEFKQLYDEGKVLVVDVRDEGGFAAGHIPKARLIPLEDVEARAPELKKQKLPVVTYCS